MTTILNFFLLLPPITVDLFHTNAPFLLLPPASCGIEEAEQPEGHQESEEGHGDAPLIPAPNTSALEEMANYSNKRKLRHTRRSLETAVPT